MNDPLRAESQRTETLEIYSIQPGDTLAMLAQLYYGDARFARYIHEANPQVRDPNAMPVGTQIRIPSVPKETQVANMLTAERGAGQSESAPVRQSQTTQASTSAPTRSTQATSAPQPTERTYTVRSGDSFYAIAERELGSGPRWKELLALNRDLVKGDPQRLRPGMVLKIPAK